MDAFELPGLTPELIGQIIIVGSILAGLAFLGAVFAPHAIAAYAGLPNAKLETIRQWQAERRVRAEIQSKGFPAIHDFFMDLGYGLIQIDHMVLIGSRIFVIETRAWTGRIDGIAEDRKWTLLDRRGREIQLTNPIWSSFAYVGVLRDRFHHGRFEGLVALHPSARFVGAEGWPRGVVRYNTIAWKLRQHEREEVSLEIQTVWQQLNALKANQDKRSLRRSYRQLVEDRASVVEARLSMTSNA